MSGQVDDLGALLAVVTVNAGNIEGNRGALGILNRIGDWLLLLAHRARANTVRPDYLVWHKSPYYGDCIKCCTVSFPCGDESDCDTIAGIGGNCSDTSKLHGMHAVVVS